MQGVVLAAGKGTRLQGINLSNKCLLPFQDKTLLEFNLSLLVELELSEIILIVGHHADHIKQRIGDKYAGVPVRYVTQEPLLGIAHGVLMATPLIHQDFFMCLSDEYLFNPNIPKMVEWFYQTNADCTCGMVKDNEANIRNSYTVLTDDSRKILDLVEKPSSAYNNWKGTGYCAMKPSMIQLLPSLPPNPKRGEYEMGDWIMSGVKSDYLCNIAPIAQVEININTNDDLRKLISYEEVHTS